MSGFDEFSRIVLEQDFDIVAVTETWLTGDVRDEIISIRGYNFIHVPRATRGGGVGFYYKDNYSGYITDGPEDDGTYDPRKYENPDQNLSPQPNYQNQPQAPRKYTSQYSETEDEGSQQTYNPPPPALSADIYQQRRSRLPPQYNDVNDNPRLRYNPRY